MQVVRCDRCGDEHREEKRPSSSVWSAPVKLPRAWRRVAFPEPDGSAWNRELCERCVNALRLFLVGDGAVPGLLEHDALVAAECMCPKPQEPTPPCPIHGLEPEEEPEPEHEKAPPEDDGGREHEHLFVHSIGPCRCGSTYEDVLARTAALNDPRPNLTARAEKIASGRIPVGEKLATCPEGDGRCSGMYERGDFHGHMQRCHGVKVMDGSRKCPYCPDVASSMLELGPHIAKEHPGDWQAWVDGGQHPG